MEESKKKIDVVVVGTGEIGKTVLSKLEKHGVSVEAIPHMENPNVFHVNGVAYEPRRTECRYGGRNAGRMASIIAMAEALGGIGSMDFGGGRSRKLSPDIDIIQEFANIQQKKSKLSRWERDAVVNTFNNTYKLVKQ